VDIKQQHLFINLFINNLLTNNHNALVIASSLYLLNIYQQVFDVQLIVYSNMILIVNIDDRICCCWFKRFEEKYCIKI